MYSRNKESSAYKSDNKLLNILFTELKTLLVEELGEPKETRKVDKYKNMTITISKSEVLAYTEKMK